MENEGILPPAKKQHLNENEIVPDPIFGVPGHLIILSGFENAGKDTIASILDSKASYFRVSFATYLKKVVNVLVPTWPLDVLVADTADLKHKRDQLQPVVIMGKTYTPRELMQYVGTDLFRNNMGAGIWLELTLDNIRRVLKSGVNVCVTDARFLNEIDALLSIGGKAYAVSRSKGDLVPRKDAHQSVNEFLLRLDDMTVIENHGSLDDLKKLVVEKMLKNIN